MVSTLQIQELLQQTCALGVGLQVFGLRDMQSFIFLSSARPSEDFPTQKTYVPFGKSFASAKFCIGSDARMDKNTRLLSGWQKTPYF